MRRKFFRLWITFVLTGPRGTQSLSREPLIERPSPSETRTCTSHEKMTRRRDHRRATETDEGIRNEVSLLCLPGVDIARTVINTRNTTMITRSYLCCDVQGVSFRTNVWSHRGRLRRGDQPRGVFFGASCHEINDARAFGWFGRYLVTCRTRRGARLAFLLERNKRKERAGKSYAARGSPILQRGCVLLYSDRFRLNERRRSLHCKDLWLLGFSFSPCQRLAARNSNGEEATASCLFPAKLGFYLPR